MLLHMLALSAGAVEFTDCISASKTCPTGVLDMTLNHLMVGSDPAV